MSTHDDELIDRAAHAMTRGEPSDRLHHAVRARIETSRPRIETGRPGVEIGRPGLAKQARHLWMPLAAAAAIVLAVVVGRALLGPPDAPRPTEVASAPAAPPGLRESTATPAPSPAGLRESSARPARGRTPQRKLEVEPLVIEPIRMPLIAIDSSSGVMPIEIEDLRIEPLQIQ